MPRTTRPTRISNRVKPAWLVRLIGAAYTSAHGAERGDSASAAGSGQAGRSPVWRFDAAWYRAAYPDVAAAAVDPLAHYLGTGWQEDRRPGPGFDLAATGLFDPDWYIARNPDVPTEPGAAARHFITNGWREGRWPNPAFDPHWYMASNPDVAAQPWHPFLHYLLVGEREGRRPVPYFDPSWYRRAYEVRDGSALARWLSLGRCTGPSAELFAVAFLAGTREACAAGEDPFAAFVVAHPGSEHDATWADGLLVQQSGLFDAAFYRRHYADIRNDGVDPLGHYVRHGWHERRRPNFYFDPVVYVAENTEAARMGINLLVHYIAAGAAAGARIGWDFDPDWYARVNAGRIAADDAPLPHFLRNRAEPGVSPSPALYPVRHLAGYAEDADPFERFALERQADPGGASAAMRLIDQSGLFDVNHYGMEDAAVLDAGIDPLRHFAEQGWREIRTPNPYFNPRWYLSTNRRAAELGVNPMLHYLIEGEMAGRRPVLFFDPAWYRAHYGLAADVSPLRHYLEHRREQRHSPIPEFDVAAFKQRYGARVRPERDAFMVFLALSARDDMEPGPGFDTAAYRKRVLGRRSRYFARTEEDVIPLLHYLRAKYR